MLMPATSYADSWERDASNQEEFETAMNLIGSGVDGETYIINCTWDASVSVTPGRIRPTMTKGTLIVRSDKTDFDQMPQIQLTLQWNETDCPQAEVGHRMSIIFENMNIIGSGSYFLENRRTLFADTIALRHCDIHGQTRSIIRFDGDSGGIEGIEAADMHIHCIEIKECRLHGTAQASGDNWSVIRTFMPVDNLYIQDNMFYDMPYTKSIWETRTPGDLPTNVYFTNNMVMLAQNSTLATSGFTVLMAADDLVAGSQFFIYNNLFIGPKAGYTILVDETSTHSDTKITNVESAVVMTNSNVVDEDSYTSLSELATYLSEECGTTLIQLGNDKALSDYADFSWDTGTTFQDASNNMYYLLTSNQWYTEGYSDGIVGASYIGPSIAYVDEFPTTAAINIDIDGPSYITYSISPEKDVYYIGDEITVTLNPQTNKYLNDLNTFTGWSDGSTELSRSFTLDGDLNLTASFTEREDVVSAFTLSRITSNSNLSSYEADIYLNMDENYKSVAYGVVNDTTEATGSKEPPFTYVSGTFQTRPNKFGEDATDDQMPILSRRTWSGAKEYQRDYIVFAIPTTGLSNLHFSCYVGTDNNAAKVQKLEFSADSLTWTEIGSVEIENLTWGYLTGDLPEEANDKEKVYVRVIGDVDSEPVCTPDESVGMMVDGQIVEDVYLSIDAFEYVGSILITADTIGDTDGISEVVSEEQQIDENAPMYNLMGMKVAKGTKGIIIQNGKKFVVK